MRINYISPLHCTRGKPRGINLYDIKKPLTDKTEEVQELIQKDMRAMRTASKVLLANLIAILPKHKIGQRGQQKQPTKIALTLGYSPEAIVSCLI